MRGSAVCVWLLLAVLVSSANSRVVFCDQEADRETNLCAERVPQCLEYEYVPNPENPDKFIFRCITCQDGLVPLWTHKDIPAHENGMPQDILVMCAPNMEGKPASCTSSSCSEGPLKGCLRYTVENPQFEGPGVFTGHFKCLECFFQYEPVPEGVTLKYDASLKSRSAPFSVCRRKLGIFECGYPCQIEFPGCWRYEVSKLQGGAQTGKPETANFLCLNVMPSHTFKHQVVTASTNFKVSKQLTYAVYESEVQECNDRLCKAVLPNCQNYYTLGGSHNVIKIYCAMCKQTMTYIPEGAVSSNLINMYVDAQVAIVCNPKQLNSYRCGNECKEEFPGCNILSTVVNTDDDHPRILPAVYRCDECAPGYFKVQNEASVSSWSSNVLADNVKIRCAPNEVTQPTTPTGLLAQLLPHCLKYTATYHRPSGLYNVTQYECQQCENGWEPTSAPHLASWYSKEE